MYPSNGINGIGPHRNYNGSVVTDNNHFNNNNNLLQNKMEFAPRQHPTNTDSFMYVKTNLYYITF